MTEPGMVFLPKPSWWVRKDRIGYNTGTWGWHSTATAGVTKLGHAAGSYDWTSSPGQGTHHYDTFTRRDSTTSAGPNWTNTVGRLGISTNRAYTRSSGRNTAIFNTPMPSDDFIMSATTYRNDPTNDTDGNMFFGCNSSGAAVGCDFRAGVGNTHLYTQSSWSGARTTVGSIIGSLSYASDDEVAIQRVGTVYTLLLNGSPCWTWNDTGYTHPIDASHRLVGIGDYHLVYPTYFYDFFAKEL